MLSLPRFKAPLTMGALADLSMSENEAEHFISSLLHSYILQIMGYGMYTVIYFIALYLTLSRGTEKAQARSSILISVMWLLCTVQIAIRWATINNVFIRHPDGGWESQITVFVETFPLAIANCIISFFVVVFADVVLIWRCWALHGQRWIVIIIPILSFTVGIVVFVIQTILHFAPSGRKAPVIRSTWEIIFLGMTVFTNIFCTAAIIYRLISVGGWTKALKTYRGILEIFIESAILYTTIYLIQIGLNVYATYFSPTWDERYFYVQSLCNVITAVAPTLIIARVSAGHTRPNYSWSSTSTPRMRSTIRSLQGSIQFARPITFNSNIVDTERNTQAEDSLSSLEVEHILKEETKA